MLERENGINLFVWIIKIFLYGDSSPRILLWYSVNNFLDQTSDSKLLVDRACKHLWLHCKFGHFVKIFLMFWMTLFCGKERILNLNRNFIILSHYFLFKIPIRTYLKVKRFYRCWYGIILFSIKDKVVIILKFWWRGK